MEQLEVALLASGILFLFSLVILAFPGALRRARPTDAESRWWAELCMVFGGKSKFSEANGLCDLIVLDSVSSREGELCARVRLNVPLQNVMHSLHGGAAALIVDELTTASIMSLRCHPGVSVSMSLNYVNGCLPGTVLHVRSRVVRQGRRVMHTTAEITNDDGECMVRAGHVKFCEAPLLFLPVLWVRTSIARRVMPLLLGRAAAPAASLAVADTDQTWPRFTDPQKQKYYNELGTPDHGLLGFDRALLPAELTHVGLVRLEANAPAVHRFILARSSAAGNYTGALHGGATATLVDILGSAAIARHPELNGGSCGVATNLDVHFGAAGRGAVTFDARVLKLGGRLATVAVEARDSKNRLVAHGTITKYGKLKQASPPTL